MPRANEILPHAVLGTRAIGSSALPCTYWGFVLVFPVPFRNGTLKTDKLLGFDKKSTKKTRTCVRSCKMVLVSFPLSQKLYRIESQHPPECFMVAAVLK